ncbi:MAG: hypothetical protein INR73_09055 [Williamsia sp.]|nr:hypothetical protein [Williamsia sp.]
MKKVTLLLAAIACFCMTGAVYAQTADEIIAKHIEAIGGKDKLSKIKTLYTETSSEVMGNQSTGKTYMVDGKGFKSEMDFNGQKMIQCYTDKGGWVVNPFTGGTAPTQMSADYYNYGRSQIFTGGALYDYAAKGNKIELQGKEGNNYKLKVTTSSNAELTYYIDANTYYMNKSVGKTEMQGQIVPITINYSNFKKTDFGNVMPYTAELDFGQFAITTNVSKVEVNKDIDAGQFDQGKL